MPDPSVQKRKVTPRAEAIAALRRSQEQMKLRNLRLAEEKAAKAEAGRKALHVRAAVDGLCSAVEATQDDERHRELLELAARKSGDAIGALRSVSPVENPAGWLTGMVSGYEAAALVAKARALRGHEDRFADFLPTLARPLAEAGAAPLAIRYIEDELVRLTAAEISEPTALVGQCESAQCVLDREAHRLRSGSSLAHAWTQVRTAGDILDGAIVLLAPAMCEDPWLNSGDYTVACLCVTAGAAMMTRGFNRMLSEG